MTRRDAASPCVARPLDDLLYKHPAVVEVRVRRLGRDLLHAASEVVVAVVADKLQGVRDCRRLPPVTRHWRITDSQTMRATIEIVRESTHGVQCPPPQLAPYFNVRGRSSVPGSYRWGLG